MNIPRKMIETGARALAYEQGWNWDKFDERSRDGFRYTAQETIRAAIGCAEVVDIQADWSIKQWTSGVTIAA